MSNNTRLRQLNSLVRLRQLQRDRSAKFLANATMKLNLAEDEKSSAEARYQLILEMQRQVRKTGRSINPLYYNCQFEAADDAMLIMEDSIDTWLNAVDHKSKMLKAFSLHHNQLDVSRRAFLEVTAEYKELLEKQMMIDCYDQQSQKIKGRD